MFFGNGSGTGYTHNIYVGAVDGGTHLIANNSIEKGPNAQNNVMVHFGGEGIPYAKSSLTITGGGIAAINGGSGSLHVTGGSGAVNIVGGSLALNFVAGAGTAIIALTPGGGDLTFGSGTTVVQEASWGAAIVFRCLAGSGGGSDTIGGFGIGIDTLSLQGVGIVSEQVIGGAANIVLMDNTSMTLTGVADLTHLSG